MKQPALKLMACWLLLAHVGCQTTQKREFSEGTELEISAVALQVEYPDSHPEPCAPAVQSLAPRTIDEGEPKDFWDISLEEVITMALQNSDIIRNLGGRVLSNPDGAPSVFDPGLRDSDPQFGVEGALSAFDTQLAMDMFWSRNDQATNNIITAGGAREIVQDIGTFQSRLSKTASTGTQFSISNQTQYDQSNQPGNLFTSGWDTQFDLTVRQPLLQGAGVAFNRIAGPNAQPGFNFSSGVMIARINTDISLADFESGVRDFISEVEDAYWDLYFSYRDLDARILARDLALETWRKTRPRLGKIPGGEAANEAQAREQYHSFQDQVHDSLVGSSLGGQTVGVFRGERQLRLLLGLSANDGRLMRPKDEPSAAKVVFNWEHSLGESLVRRVELRRQRWQIKRRELELLASKNFLLPRFDAVALYRWRGFGDNLTGDTPGLAASAFKDLGSGDHQEWQISLDFDMTLGYRRAWAGVKRAELQLARDRVLLGSQELQISHSLSAAIDELNRAHKSVETRYDRLNAAIARQRASEAAHRADRITLFELLQAQQRLSESQTSYFQALSQYAKAIKNVHREKGSLLAYNGIHLSESGWPHEAYADAAELSKRWRPKLIDYRFNRPGVISQGPHHQNSLEPGLNNSPPGAPPEPIPTPATPLREDQRPVPLETNLAPEPTLLGGRPALRRLPSVNGEIADPSNSIASGARRAADSRQGSAFIPPGPRGPTQYQGAGRFPGAPVSYDEDSRPANRFSAPRAPLPIRSQFER